jgi:hypothetical protein
MNTTGIKIGEDIIPCSNPKLLTALLKRASTAAKVSFRSTEGELLNMFNAVDLVNEMKDTIKRLDDELKSFILKQESKPKQAATMPNVKAEEKVAKAAAPKKKVVRRKRRSDFGKKREGKALENIRRAQQQLKAKRRLTLRLEAAKQQTAKA